MIKLFKFFIVFIMIVLFFGCSDEKEYGNVHYDRDVCEHCKMVISDNKFSVDVLFDGQNHYFDDMGCFVAEAVASNHEQWLKSAKVYINDLDTGEFINAREAYFYKGYKTPMNYGWAASAKRLEGKESFKFDEVVEILKKHGPHNHMHKE